MKRIILVLLVLLMCGGCRKETIGENQARQDSSANREANERSFAIECEMTNMPQKLKGNGWDTMYWGVDLVKSIMALDDQNERTRLSNRYLDLMSQLMPSLNMRRDCSLAFYNYESMMESCAILAKEPEIAERVLGIMCECIYMHRWEIEKWADAINREPNYRARVPMKNIHGCLRSDFLMFTNRIERTYFPFIKSHGLHPDREGHWRRQVNAAYGTGGGR